MNTNTKPRQRSEKAKEGRRRRQRERRRRQREERRQHYIWTNDEEWDYDDDDGHYYDIYEDLCERTKFIICDDKFSGCKKDFEELSRKMAQIFTSQNSSSVPNNLKTYEFKLLDEFIAKTPPSDNLNQFKISCRDLYNGKKLYNQMKDNPNPNYEFFGSNGMGYTCFGLFKSNDKNMYIIVIDGHNDNRTSHYVKIENETIFHDI
jgi:hypothetical protein